MSAEQSPLTLETWLRTAEEKLERGVLNREDLREVLKVTASATVPGKKRQRLLYLHSATLSIHDPLVAAVLHEPIPGHRTKVDPLAPQLPFNTVFDAIVDGWRIIHFPDQRAPFDDREIDVVGYEFILEKLEAYDE